MSGRNRKALLSDAEIEEIAQKVIEVLDGAGKDDAEKDDSEKDEAPASEHLEETLFSSDNRRTAMSVQNLIVASVATRSVFRRFAQLSDEEKEEVVKKVKEKMSIKDDEEDSGEDADTDTNEDTSEDKPEEETGETTEQEDVEGDEGKDTNEDTSEDTEGDEKSEGESEDDTEEVEEIPDESEDESGEVEEPAPENESEDEESDETEELEPEEQKEEIEEIVNGLVEEVQTIKQDGNVKPKDVLGLITNMMEMVNLLVQAKPPTRRRRRNSATREFEIAMKVSSKTAGYSYAIQPFALQLTGWQPVNVDVLRVIDRTWFDCEDEEGEHHEGGGRMMGLNWKQLFPTHYLNYAQEQEMKKQGKAPVYEVRGRIPEGSAQNALAAISKALGKFDYDDVKVIG